MALGLLLAGCLGSADPEPTPAGPPAATLPSGAAGEGNASAPPAAPPASEAAVPPPATVATAGLSWDACLHWNTGVPYPLGWGEGLVPADYQPSDTGAALGQFRVSLLDCEAVTIGDQTFRKDVALLVLGILVHPPAAWDGAGGDLYLLDVLATDGLVASQLADLEAPASLATITVGAEGYSFDSGAGSVGQVDRVQALPVSDEETGAGRLHWQGSRGPCWMDLQATRTLTAETRDVVMGSEGRLARLTGPGGRLAGVGFDAQESGYLTAPTCLAVAA